MYIQPIFAMTDREAQLHVIRETAWGYIVGIQDGVPIATPLPFLVEGESGRERLVGHMARATVSFEIPIARIEANFRLMQNRPATDRHRVAAALAESDDTNTRGVAALMHRYSLEAAE